MENNFKKIANVCRMIPKDEPMTYSRLATLFEQLAEMEASKNLVQPDVIKSVYCREQAIKGDTFKCKEQCDSCRKLMQ